MSAVPSPSSPDLSGQAKLGGGADAFNAQPSSHSSSPANSTSARQRQAEAAQAAALKPSHQQQAIDAQDHINQVLQSALFVKGGAGADSNASSQQPRSQHPLNPNSAPYSSPNLYRSYPNGGGGPNPYSPYSPQPRSAVPSGSSSGVPYTGNGGYDYSQYYPTGSSPDQSYSSVDSPRMGGAFNPYAAVPAEGFDFQGYGSPQSTSRGSIGGGNGLGVGAPPFNPYEQQQGGGGAGRPYWQMGMPGSPAGGFSPQLNGGANGDRKNSYPGMFSPLPHSAYPLDHQGIPSPAFSSNGRFSRQSHGQTASQSQIHQQQQQAGARLRGGGARFPSRTLGFGGNGSMAGNGYGGPGAFHHPTPAIPRSPLLEEFRNNKSRQWGLADIADHVVEFSKDQHGSRFIQQKLEGASDEDRQLVFKEVVTDAFSIQTDVFGNYVIQKLFEFGDASQKTELAQTMSGNVLRLSLQTYGCRAIQKALEHVEAEQRAALVGELKGSILECVKSSNANHVVQRIVSLPEPGLDFVDAFRGQVFELSTHPYGCRVLQRCFEHLPQEQTRPLLDEMHQFTQNLVLDQFGNYVVQYVLEHGTDDDRRQIIAKLRGQMLHLARHKFASNVCEKALITASAEDRRELIQEIMLPSSIIVLLKDAYGNYVLQRILRSIAPDQKPELVEMIKPLLEQMRKVSTSSYSKHLISVERLLADRPESLLPASLPSSLPQTPSTTDHGSSSAPNSSVPTPSNRSDEGALVESLGGLALNGKGDSANGA